MKKVVKKKMKQTTKNTKSGTAKAAHPKARNDSWLSLSRSRLYLFVLAFATVGAYLLFTSFAATNTMSISGKLNNKRPSASHTIQVTATGDLVANVSFSRLNSLSLQLKDPAGTVVGTASSTSSAVSLTRPVSPGTYQLVISGQGSGSYSGTVTFPTSDNQPPPTADTTPPSAPANLAANAASSSQINLSWSASTDNIGVTAYEVYRNNVLVTTVVTTSYSDLSLAPATTYSYYIKAKDAAGNRSPASSTAIATTQDAADATRPAVSITAPTGGATISGTVNVTGTASDNTALAKVEIQVNNNGFVVAGGTTSWSYSLNTTLYTNTTHTITARATDTAGNQQTASVSVTISNGTTTTTAPNTQGTWTSPEGAVIDVKTAGTNPATGKPWTIVDVYRLLLDNSAAPGDLNRIGPNLTIRLQDTYASFTGTTAVGMPGAYTSVRSAMWLKGVNSTFSSRPDQQFAHEYGHAWSMHHHYFGDGGDWMPYFNARWTTADGSMTLASDSRLDTSYTWSRGEIIADDYRLLFGSAAAVAQAPNHMNFDIPEPGDVRGLRDYLLGPFRSP